MVEDCEEQSDNGQGVELVGFVDVEVGVGEGRRTKFAHPDCEVESDDEAAHYNSVEVSWLSSVLKHCPVAHSHYYLFHSPTNFIQLLFT